MLLITHLCTQTHTHTLHGKAVTCEGQQVVSDVSASQHHPASH